MYCLSVANAPEFYANGVLVHNCGHLWGDEFGLYGNSEAIDMALFGLRLGDRVTSCWTSTPKMTKSTKYVLALERAFIKRMRMRDNLMNLAPGVVEQLERKYGGTRLGQQELDGEILEDVAGALWKPEWFRRDGFRLPLALGKSGGQLLFDPPKQIIQTVVALDPSVSDPERKRNPHKDPDACGIVVAGIDEIGRGYVLADMTAVMAPADWARTAVSLYTMCRCSKIVAESNQGGALISEVIKGVSSNVPVELVTASMGKRPRAEPVAVLYEQGRVSHCGSMNDLEDQMLTWDASDPSQPSPNNVDALVWAFHGLGLCNATGSKISSGIKSYGT